MFWSEIRKAYPDRWLIVEALDAYTTQNQERRLEHLAIIETCKDGKDAFQRYRLLHQEYPYREFYFVHTSRKNLDIQEQQWQGIRRKDGIVPQK